MKMSKTGWHMKENCLILILLVIFSFLFGCASVGPKVYKMEEGFISDISKHKDMKIGLIHSKSFHLGSTGRPVAFGFAGYIKTSEEEEFAHNLDVKYCKVIEEVISKKAPFQLISEQLKDIPKLSSPAKLLHPAFNAKQDDKKKERREKNRKLVKQFVDSNGLNGVLLISCAHQVIGYVVYKVTLRTYWILYDHDGREVFEMRTKYKSEESDTFANTLDPKYEPTYLKFVKRSTKDFIAMLMKNN